MTQRMRLPGVVLLVLALSAHAGAQDQSGQGRPSPPATSLSGYMDFHYNNPELSPGELDFHRFVLLLTHRFTDRIRFVGELELEHAFVEGLEPAGELELEQAYVDFLLSRSFNVRAGMLLMPVGIINERHEPPVYYGVERPFVDTVIIPSTWFEAGAGVHGELSRGWRYRAYLAAPLNAAEFTADEGLRDARQKGSRTHVGRAAVTGRLEYVGSRGLTVGASAWHGESGFAFHPRFEVPVSVFEADGRYERERLGLRAQIAHVGIGGAADLNAAIARTTGVNPNLARAMRGAYVEAGYRVISGARFGDVGAFVRYEKFDTQFRMPPGYLPRREFDRDAWLMGLTFWPDADVAIKADYTIVRNRSVAIKAPDGFNLGLGWWF